MGRTYFRTMQHRVNLSFAAVRPDSLREAQIGALMAVAAHTTSSGQPAQVIVPTGVGKTSIAMLAPYVLGCERVLVVVPSKLVRSQVQAEFATPTRAVAGGVLPKARKAPRVMLAEHQSKNGDLSFERADVVIGTPQVLSPGYDGVDAMPRDLFDLIIFDEAHHLPARTWKLLLAAADARTILLTATPFRNDGQRLPGELVYTYPLARAMERGVFGEVTYRPIDEVDGEAIDVTIAKAAAARLRSKEHQAAGSRMLVRSNSVNDAKDLVKTYADVDVPLGLIVHDTPWKDAERMRAEVERGDLFGFVCVGVLTEGFDFPALKIGAYHAPHRTLGPTVQFIGRLSRAREIAGELLAPRAAVSTETAELYREDVGWRELLPDLLDSAVAYERDVRAYVKASDIAGELELPPLSITPSRNAHIYITSTPPDPSAAPARIANSPVVQKIVHAQSRTLALVTRRIERPRFLRLDTLDVAIYDLHVVTWVENQQALFVSTTTDAARRDILRTIAPGLRRSLSGEELRRLLDAAKLDRYFSIGTRASRVQGSSTSYRIRAGSQTERDLTPADARGWDLGHGIGRAGKGTFGFSVAKSKIWAPGAADSLFAFRVWCERQAKELGRPPTKRAASKLDMLGISEPVGSFPSLPVVALLPVTMFSEGHTVLLDGEVLVPELVELWADDNASGPDVVVLSVTVEGKGVAHLRCELDGTVSTTGANLLVHDPATGDKPTLADYLTKEPPTIFFADGARVTGDRVAQPPSSVSPVAAEVRRARTWKSTAITVEFGVPPKGKVNVGTATADLLKAEMQFVIQDHLAGELADFIAIDPTRLTPEVRLVHCKASGGKKPGARLGDVQELAAQAMRSVQWLSAGTDLWKQLRHRVEHRNATKIVQGDRNDVIALLDRWSSQPPPAMWSIWLVQPGVSDARLDRADTVTSLLNAVHSWVASQDVELALVCSR